MPTNVFVHIMVPNVYDIKQLKAISFDNNIKLIPITLISLLFFSLVPYYVICATSPCAILTVLINPLSHNTLNNTITVSLFYLKQYV